MLLREIKVFQRSISCGSKSDLELEDSNRSMGRLLNDKLKITNCRTPKPKRLLRWNAHDNHKNIFTDEILHIVEVSIVTVFLRKVQENQSNALEACKKQA
ncbi:hypothetical protein Trydic_g18914 [Trypoxylus dichotomus]